MEIILKTFVLSFILRQGFIMVQCGCVNLNLASVSYMKIIKGYHCDKFCQKIVTLAHISLKSKKTM